MKRWIYTFIPLLIILFACKKDSNESQDPPAPPPVAVKINYTLDSTTVKPGKFVTIRADKAISKDTCTVAIGPTSVLLSKIDSLHYGFIVPVLQPGPYTIDLTPVDGATKPALMVASYPVIFNPDLVVQQVISSYNNLVDTLRSNSVNDLVTANDAKFMHQLMVQLNEIFKSCTAEQKVLIAYQLQNMDMNSLLGRKNTLDSTYMVKRIGQNFDDEIGAQVNQLSIEFKAKLFAALTAVVGLVAAVQLARVSKHPATIVAVLAGAAAYYFLTRSAANTGGEVAATAGVVMSEFRNTDGSGSPTNPVELKPQNPIWQNFTARFRTLQRSDATSSLSSNISESIQQSDKLQDADRNFKEKFEDLKALIKSFFGEITTEYKAYITPIQAIAKEKIAAVKNPFISVANASNTDIQVAVSSDGSKGLKITATNTSGNITTETPFTFDLVYTQAALNNNKVVTTQRAKFIPIVVSTLTTSAPTSITKTSAISGGTITNDGGSEVTARGVCWSTSANPTIQNSKTINGTGKGSFVSSLQGLNENTTYHVRAYATNSIGTAYGNDITFTTTSTTLPTLSTAIPGSVTISSASLGGTIIDDGGSAILDKGIIYSTNSAFAPSTSVSMGSGGGAFLQTVSGLNENTSYFAKAYATNSSGTGYGNVIDFGTTGEGIANKYWDITIGHDTRPNVYDYALVIFKPDSTLKFTEPAYPGVYDSNGVWSMSGSTINWSINLGNYQFSGTVQGDKMSGTFKSSSATGTWTGSVH